MADSFQININFDNIDKHAKKFNDFADYKLEKALQDGIDELSDRLYNKMGEYLILYGLGGSELMNTRFSVPYGNGIRIGCGSDHVAFVEFGTGIVGKGNPHPKRRDWIYDVNGHGDNGWWYPTDNPYPNQPTKYYNGKLYAWTAGMASRPFMYKTWLWGSQHATQIVKKHVNRAIKELV